MIVAAVFAVLAVVVAIALHRDLERADARRRTRLMLAPLRRDLIRFQVQIQDALTPALADAARELSRCADALVKFGKAAR